jgi:hypothetical protein
MIFIKKIKLENKFVIIEWIGIFEYKIKVIVKMI